MKTASRIIGTLMMVAAIGFLAVVAYLAFNENWSTATAVEWEASGILLILASALLLGGRSYLRFDPEAEGRQQPASEATDFLITHRARLKVLAEIGLALSVIRIATAFVHSDWLGIYSNFWLAAGVVVLFYWARKMANPSVAGNHDWQRVPEWIRRSLPRLWQVAVGASIVLLGIRQWFHTSITPDNRTYVVIERIVSGMCLSLFYTIEALYFKYGELRPAHGTGPAE